MNTYCTDILLPSSPYQSTNYHSHSHPLTAHTPKGIKEELTAEVQKMAARCPNASVISANTTDGRIVVSASNRDGQWEYSQRVYRVRL